MPHDDDRWVLPVELTPPSLDDNTADAERLEAALCAALGADAVHMDLGLLRSLPAKLRSGDYRARCVVFRQGQRWVLVDALPPDGPTRALGAAVDLGTTRVVLRLVDLESGEPLGEGHFDNPQVQIGPDILTRVHFAAKEGGLERLRELVSTGIDEELGRLCGEAGVDRREVYLLAVAGNTTMTHLLLGLEPHWLIRSPYIPAANEPGLLPAGQLGIHGAPSARAYVFPNRGSYFGGDVIAGVLFSGMSRAEETSLLVDVGTNAEVVLGGSDWLLACAGAAGPALESGVAEIGMTADEGVIERVRIAEGSLTFELDTIGGAPPKGICGSGLIDLAAVLFRAGMIDERGKLVPSKCGPHVEETDEGPRLVLVPADRSATGAALTLGQPALDSLTKSKAAMYSILETITASVGLSLSEVERFHVAGAFGSVIDPDSAITIGMLPDLPRSAFHVLGNSSLGGATLLLGSRRHLDEVATIQERVTYLELNVNQDFMNRFNGAQFYPHTDRSLFPSVAEPL